LSTSATTNDPLGEDVAEGSAGTEIGDKRDIAALARGGRTNFFGFLLRLGASAPFLMIAGRLYGAEAMGRFASARVVIELAGQLCTLGQKRGLAQRLAVDTRHAANIIADGMVLSLMIAGAVGVALFILPAPMFPSGRFTAIDLWLPVTIFPATLTDIALAALAYRYDVGATVKARSVVEPWALSLAAGVVYFIRPLRESGLALAYIISIYASFVAAMWPLLRSFGLPRGWSPHPLRIARLAASTMPLAVADTVEWGTRKLDIFILGLYASPTSVGVYFVAQQVASLPQKLKTSFEPILGPVIARNIKTRNYTVIARQVCQVGFWITASQIGIALALGIPGAGVLGLFGPKFVGGTGALAFLLGAEVVAATAVVSEAALIYIAPVRNLAISLATIGLQALLTVTGMYVDGAFQLGEMDQASSAAGALLVTLAITSLVKSGVLAHFLGHKVSNWRWPLVWAAGPAAAVGWAAARFLPEWAELAFGVPAILGTYSFVIWHKGFGPDDRMLFGKGGGAKAD